MDQLLQCKKTNAIACRLLVDKGTTNAAPLKSARSLPGANHCHHISSLSLLILLLYLFSSYVAFAESVDATGLPQDHNCLTSDNQDAAYQDYHLLREGLTPTNSVFTAQFFELIDISLNTDSSTIEETSYEQGNFSHG